VSDISFDPMNIKLSDIKTIEKDFGVPFMKFIKRLESSKGIDMGELSMAELQAMIFIAGAASGQKRTAKELDDMSFGDLTEILSGLNIESVASNPTSG